MAKRGRKAREDLSQEGEGFGNTPFAQLPGQLGDLPDAPTREPEGTDEPVHREYGVGRTRKGGWPLRVERRSGGKTVTVLERVSGDAQLLLDRLKRHCGAGGAVREGYIEIQGDQRERIERFLERA